MGTRVLTFYVLSIKVMERNQQLHPYYADSHTLHVPKWTAMNKEVLWATGKQVHTHE